MDWSSAEGAFDYIRRETDELEAAMQQGSQQQIEEELGDLLFSCVNTARHLHVDAETALRSASMKFLRRFRQTEQLVTADGKDMSALPIEELDRYWDQAKRQISGGE
jgi:tetrapyrrole methylase family protein/MazG family protein